MPRYVGESWVIWKLNFDRIVLLEMLHINCIIRNIADGLTIKGYGLCSALESEGLRVFGFRTFRTNLALLWSNIYAIMTPIINHPFAERRATAAAALVQTCRGSGEAITCLSEVGFTQLSMRKGKICP